VLVGVGEGVGEGVGVGVGVVVGVVVVVVVVVVIFCFGDVEKWTRRRAPGGVCFA